MTEPSSLKRALLLGAVVPVLTVFALGCSSSSKNSSADTSSSTNGNAASSTTAAAPGSTNSDIAGTWTGDYSGTFTGTFTVTWSTSGSSLSGTIKISGFGNADTPISGSLQGDQITFGTVGSQEITYKGSVSGSSMSGTWTVVQGGNTAGSGSWNATKS
jgi:hypothetical protein